MRTFTLIAVALLLSLTCLQSANAQCPAPTPDDYPNIPFYAHSQQLSYFQTIVAASSPFNGAEERLRIMAEK